MLARLRTTARYAPRVHAGNLDITATRRAAGSREALRAARVRLDPDTGEVIEL